MKRLSPSPPPPPDRAAATADILKKVRAIEIRTRRLVTDAVSGAYHSSFRGRGMDFEEVREYAPGDDVRAIDWNVTARMDRPFIKKFREERELTLFLLLDLSASGAFGSGLQTKRELAAEVASVLAFSATRNLDKVGLLLFTDRVEKFIPPKKGRWHILRVIREMLFFRPVGRGTDIAAALRFLETAARRRAIVFLLTDFLDESGPAGLPAEDFSAYPPLQALSLANRRHDCIAIRLQDPRECDLPPAGLILLEDAETGAVAEIDTTTLHRRLAFRHRNEKRLAALDRALQRQGIDTLSVTTGQPYIQTLRALFSRRGSRL